MTAKLEAVKPTEECRFAGLPARVLLFETRSPMVGIEGAGLHWIDACVDQGFVGPLKGVLHCSGGCSLPVYFAVPPDGLTITFPWSPCLGWTVEWRPGASAPVTICPRCRADESYRGGCGVTELREK